MSSILAACSSSGSANFITIDRQETIVPNTDILQLKPVDWIVVTPANSDEVFAQSENNQVLFSVTRIGFENLMLNLNDLMSLIRQQQIIIEAKQ